MAERGVFICKDTYPFFEEVRVQFDWFPALRCPSSVKAKSAFTAISWQHTLNRKYWKSLLHHFTLLVRH